MIEPPCLVSSILSSLLGEFKDVEGLGIEVDKRRQRITKEYNKKRYPIGYLFLLERETGIEPATPSLARRCSTAEPLAHVLVCHKQV